MLGVQAKEQFMMHISKAFADPLILALMYIYKKPTAKKMNKKWEREKIFRIQMKLVLNHPFFVNVEKLKKKKEKNLEISTMYREHTLFCMKTTLHHFSTQDKHYSG